MTLKPSPIAPRPGELVADPQPERERLLEAVACLARVALMLADLLEEADAEIAELRAVMAELAEFDGWRGLYNAPRAFAAKQRALKLLERAGRE